MPGAASLLRTGMDSNGKVTSASTATVGGNAGWSEEQRVDALRAYAILDTPTEPEFDDLVRLAAETFGAPIAVVNLVADDRQWFKAEVGIGARQLPLDVSICRHAILQDDFMVVPDTREDDRFTRNPLVTAEGGLRFYAGALLRNVEGYPIGTVCVLDRQPRPEGITSHQRLVLEVLARQVMAQLDLRRAALEQRHRTDELVGVIASNDQARTALMQAEERYRLVSLATNDAVWDWDLATNHVVWNAALETAYGYAPAQVEPTGDWWLAHIHPDDRARIDTSIHTVIEGDTGSWSDEYRFRRSDDSYASVLDRGHVIRDERGRAIRMIGAMLDISERRLAERALKESETQLRFLRALDEALQAAADARAAMIAATTLLARHLGASRCAYADVDGDSDRFIIRDDYVAPGIASSAGTYSLDLFGSRAVSDMRGGQTLIVRDVPGELAPADGRDMFQSIGIDAIICCPLVKEQRLVAMMAVHQDRPRDWQPDEITLVEAAVERCWSHIQRIGAEARLRESEERYRTLFEAVDAGFAIAEMRFDHQIPVDYRLIEMNPAFERQTGMGGLVGRWVRDAIPELEQHWFDTYGRVALTGEPARFEDFAAPMGRWFDVHAFRTGSPERRLVAILFNDITERRRSEEMLRELNESLETQVAERTAELRLARDIIEATTSPICAFDEDYRLIAFNKAHNDEFRRVNGFDTKVGDVFPDLFMPEQRGTMRNLMTRALAGERFTVVEAFGRPEFGQPYWEITYQPLRDSAGAIIGAFHMANDISDRLAAERELASAQEALRQSQKMEAMGSLTGGVAHDFNNLLTPIVGSLDMLQRKGVGSEREQRLIGGALQSAERAKTLVQRLLAFARRQPLQPRAVDVAALIAGMAELVASTSGPQTRVIVDVADDLPAALADENQLEMAILNLSVNARDAMPSGGRLSISAREVVVGGNHVTGLKSGRYVRLSVADTGTGMDAETLRRAIEPFYSTKGIGKGTGLGLSMVHGLAAQLGGALSIDSRPGLGTDVQLWLPATTQAVETGERVEEASIVPQVGCALVVDDEEIVRASTADMLADLGYDIVEACSAEQATQLLEGGLAPDLLVTDHLMPGKSGTDLAREVLERLPGTRVLIVSGYADADGIAPDLPRLVKPFRQADLAASISDEKPRRDASLTDVR